MLQNMTTKFFSCLVLTCLLCPSLYAQGKGKGTTPAPPPPPVLKVSVVGTSIIKHIRHGVTVRFENPSLRGIQILRQLDGSEWGWHMPFYKLTIADSSGKTIPIGGRCGNSGLWSGPKWPDDYRLMIGPGEAHELVVDLNREIPEAGEYTVTFEYHYDPVVTAAKGATGIKYPDDLWVGKARSEPVVISLPKLP